MGLKMKFDPPRELRLFVILTIAFFALTVLSSFYYSSLEVRTPCSSFIPTSKIDFFPKKIKLGSPLCMAIPDLANTSDKVTFHLMLDGLELTDSAGTLADSEKHLVQFEVKRGLDDVPRWRKIIGRPGWGQNGAALGSTKVQVGVAIKTQAGADSITPETDTREFAGASTPLELTIVDPPTFLAGFVTFLAAVIALIIGAKLSAILRDGAAGTTYSLGRVQMAFWLYLITASFIYIWLVTGDYNGILTPQALTLLGISATTSLMAVAAGNGTIGQSVGFWNDILTEPGNPPAGVVAPEPVSGIALHRLQIVVWTGILGVVFVVEVYNSFQLPAFDSNLLILMGLSGGTYVGFKLKE
jgi:hypothetical protein